MKKLIDIQKLIISQDGVHTPEQIPAMIEHVQNGGVFNRALLDDWANLCCVKPAPLIKITFFPDDVMLLQDGHHRVMSIYLGGRNFILPEEYSIEYWDYEDYLQINPKWKWVTPYDPRTHIRHRDFHEYKNAALKIYNQCVEQGIIEEHAIKYLEYHAEAASDLYRKPRSAYTIMDLAEAYEKDQKHEPLSEI